MLIILSVMKLLNITYTNNDNDIYYCIYGLSASHGSGLKRNNLPLVNLMFIVHCCVYFVSVYFVSNHMQQ